MPEKTPQAHLIGFPSNRLPQHRCYVEGFLYVRKAEGKSPATLASYQENLGRFLAATKELDPPSQPVDIGRQHVRMFPACHLPDCQPLLTRD